MTTSPTVRPGELREAAAAQLNKRVMQATLQGMAVDAAAQAALEDQKHKLAKLYEQRLAKELSERWPVATARPATSGSTTPRYRLLTFELRHRGGKASSGELTELVKKFYGSAGDTVHLFGARHMQFIEKACWPCLWTAPTPSRSTTACAPCAPRWGLVESAHAIRQYLQAQYPAATCRALRSTGAAQRAGDADRAAGPAHGTAAQTLPVGDAVSATHVAGKAGPCPYWAITASVSTAAQHHGRRAD